jgi:hypothetical protein
MTRLSSFRSTSSEMNKIPQNRVETPEIMASISI